MPKNRQSKVGESADAAERKAKRTLAQVAHTLAPRTIGPQEATALARSIANSLATLPPDQALIMRQRVGVAVSELDALIAELKGELSSLGQELKTVAAHSGAAAAYTRRADSRSR